MKTTYLALPALLLSALPALAFDLQRDWLVSHWPAGQSHLVEWSPAMVRPGPEGLDITLDANPAATPPDTTAAPTPDASQPQRSAASATQPESPRPFLGGEIQSRATAETGIWRWTVRAPRMVEGAVFGLFLYRANHDKDPWREYDIEFVGGGTTVVELNIHFEDAAGKHVSLKGGPRRIDLGFDAAAGFHDYEIEVLPQRAIFRIDGRVVGEFGPSDILGDVWSDGPLRSFVDLWAVAPAQADWAGHWSFDGTPLTATLKEATVP